MPDNFYFIDTNVGIQRLFDKEFDNKYPDYKNLQTSTFVIGEFIRTFILDCCALYSMVLEVEDIRILYRRFKSMKTTPDARNAIRLEKILNSLTTEDVSLNKKKILENLEMYIEGFLIKGFKSNLRILNSKTDCKLHKLDPKLKEGKYFLELLCKDGSILMECSLVSSLDENIELFEKLLQEFVGIDDYKDRIDTINKITQGLRELKLEDCISIGDILISFDCPFESILLSRDPHMGKICGVVGKECEIYS